MKRIRVHYRLAVDAEHHETARRVHEAHARHCPVYRSLTPAIDISTELELVAPR